MRTIVEYVDANPPWNEYPPHILSPTRRGPCSADHMRAIAKPHRDWGRFVYKRCDRCGYTVRCFVGLDWGWIRVQLAQPVCPVPRRWKAVGTPHRRVPRRG